MIENQPSSTFSASKTKKVSIQERSVHVGDFVVVNGYRVNHTLLKKRFAEGGYQTHETKHFLLFTRAEEPKNILVHWFAPDVLQSDIEHDIVHEIQPLGLIQNPNDQQTILGGVFDSFDTQDTQIEERTVPVGDIWVMNGCGLRHHSLKRRFLQSGYQVQETPHFLLCIRDKAPSTVLVHWFTPENLNTSVSSHLVEELKPFGTIPDSVRLGEFMTGIVGTTFPENVRRAWFYFGANTLQHLLRFVSTSAPDIPPDYGALEMSATLYQRVCELCVGERYLDAGCSSGFFALLLAERRPFVKEIIAIDIDKDVFTVSQELALARNLTTVRYVQADLLSDKVCTLGSFDTVTALHVLEHFTEVDMYRVLSNLLRMTAHHLILAVPYEQEPSVAYDHLQCFSRAKLEAVGVWCIEQMDGVGRMWCEDLLGSAILLIEKLAV